MMGNESPGQLYDRLVVEDRARQLASAKTEQEVISLIRISVSELENAVDRLERFLSTPGEGS